jgi:hypothetical protein
VTSYTPRHRVPILVTYYDMQNQEFSHHSPVYLKPSFSFVFSYVISAPPISKCETAPMAVRSKARTVFDCFNIGIARVCCMCIYGYVLACACAGICVFMGV